MKHFLIVLLFLSGFTAFLFTAPKTSAFPSRLPEGIDPAEILQEAKERRENWQGFEELELAQMSALGIRYIQGDHVDFYTDLAESPDIGVIVPILDASIEKLCEFFELDTAEYRNWRVEAFLINNREPFEIFGAFDRAPEFEHGYSLENRIWIYDKKQPYYNRFLLLHELVHSFMDAAFGTLNPRWYSEGIAEYLGLHQWDGKELTLGCFPNTSSDFPGFGRIDRIRELVREGRAKSIEEILDFEADDYRDNDTYAWSWGLVTLLLHSPRYTDAVKSLPWLMAQEHPNRLFWDMIGAEKEHLQLDWGEWISTIDYGADFTPFSRDIPQGSLLTAQEEITLDVTVPGWQSTSIRVKAGKEYALKASGRFRVYDPRFSRKFPCEANGISLRYYDGAPTGQLYAVVLPSKRPAKSAVLTPWNEAVPVTSAKKIVPDQDGILFFRFNIPTGAAQKSEGNISITVTPVD